MNWDWAEIQRRSVGNVERFALELADYQLNHNPLYRRYAEAVGLDRPGGLTKIPFLPVSFFKEQLVMTGSFTPEAIFESSGTTGMVPSRHAVRDLSLYRDQLMQNFERVYGPVTDWTMLALLPSYLERGNSSLVYMVQQLIEKGGQVDSGFYLNEWDPLIAQLEKGEREGRKTLLIGVGFALLDLSDRYQASFQHTTVLETGGMKGRRKEWVREELHEHLCKSFGLPTVHSEYGMTELLSQAYSVGDGIFECPPWMRVLVHEEEDPLSVNTSGRGLLNVIDLTNIHSCAFIATDDIGEVFADGRFTVLGRRDHAEWRGCSLLVTG
ncbi:MAG: acyl transferase [Bacteroidetes bacterium]|nr:acyl transferase [Bacteroidota bacterium]